MRTTFDGSRTSDAAVPCHPTAQASRHMLARLAAMLAAFALVLTSLLVPVAPASAATVRISKTAINVPAEGLRPGGMFMWSITVSCSAVDEPACNGLTITDTFGTEFVPSIAPGTYTWEGDTDTSPPGGTIFSTLATQVPVTYSFDAATGEFSLTVSAVAAGGQASLQVPMSLSAATELSDGAEVTNTACVQASNASQECIDGSVTVSVPTASSVTATNKWKGNVAIAGSAAVSTVTLGVQNKSSGEPQSVALQLTDQTNGDPATDTWNHLNLTGIGAVTFPANAPQVQVGYCLLPYPATCGDRDWTLGAIQTTSPLVVDPGTDLVKVTGVEFVFRSADGTPIPNRGKASVSFDLTLRDTDRATDEPLEPTTTVTLVNSATPVVWTTDDVLTVGRPATSTFRIVPSTPAVAVRKQWFADLDQDWKVDAHGQQGLAHWPVSTLVEATNRSLFPVESITVREPNSATSASGLGYVDVSSVRFRFPQGATTATGRLTCSDGPSVEIALPAQQDPVIWNRPGNFSCSSVESIEVAYHSPAGASAIVPEAVAGLDVQGRLNGTAVPGDYPSCAGGDVVNTGSGTGSGSSEGCATLTVIEARNPAGAGMKTVSQTTLPPDTPITYSMEFINTGNYPLADLHLLEPADRQVTEDSQPYVHTRLESIRATCSDGVATEIDLLLPSGDPNDPITVPAAEASEVLFDSARGFDVHLTSELPVNGTCSVQVVVERRPQAPDGVTVSNCYLAINNGEPVTGRVDTTMVCSAAVTTSVANSSASLQKTISPTKVARPVPGLASQLGLVKLRVSNSGNTRLSELQVTDFDDDGEGSNFFRAFDFVRLRGVSFPPGADTVRVDVCTTGCANGDWITGNAQKSTIPRLPSGVNTGEIRGVRVSFSSSSSANDGVNLTPGSDFPSGGPCPQASVCFSVTPRTTDRNTGQAILGTYTNTATGSATARDHLGGTVTIPGALDDLSVTSGVPALDVTKSVVGSANLVPGGVVTFDLTVRSTGTDSVTDLLVSDPIPDGLLFAENGVNGQPYRIVAFDTPAGVDPPLLENFVAERDADGTVTRLVWAFPGQTPPNSTVVIRIGMRLAGGVAAGTQLLNVFGAGSAVTDDVICSSSSNGVVLGEPFAAATNCTSRQTAVVADGGAAFDGREWVAGNSDLGFFLPASGEFTTADDPQCPTLTKAGITYTSSPCVALAYPGGLYHHLGRMTNIGTYPASSVRFVDTLSIQDDTGVIDVAPRGTEWKAAPVLTTLPVAEVTDGSTPTVTVKYAETGEPCLDDLNGGECAEDSWAATLDPVASRSFQLLLEYAAGGLAPGASADVTWTMSSPADPGSVGNPTIAWNSFGHAETVTIGAGQTKNLLAAEPPRVGIGLVDGDVEVRKSVRVETGAIVPDGEFTLAYTCTVITAAGDAVAVRDGIEHFGVDSPWRLADIPANADCAVREIDTQGGTSSHPEASPLHLIVPWSADEADGPAVGTITNTFLAPQPPVPPGPLPGQSEGPGPPGRPDVPPAQSGDQPPGAQGLLSGSDPSVHGVEVATGGRVNATTAGVVAAVVVLLSALAGLVLLGRRHS